jgi:hypothetical protein
MVLLWDPDFTREPVRRMLPWIHKSDVRQWWECKCDAFILKEAELWNLNWDTAKDFVFYSERSSDQYEIFWVEFLEKLFQWVDHLQEAPEFKEWVK